MLWAVSSILMSQQSILNKVFLNRNTHKTRLCSDGLTKRQDQRLASLPNRAFSLQAMVGF